MCHLVCFNESKHSSCCIANIGIVREKAYAIKPKNAMTWGCNRKCLSFLLVTKVGGKKEGLRLLACTIENGCDPNACKLEATLHFEFYAKGGDAFHYNHQAKSTKLQVFHICDSHM
jgi:hypothetical protein